MFVCIEGAFRYAVDQGWVDSFIQDERTDISWRDLRIDSHKPLSETEIYKSTPWAEQWLSEVAQMNRGVKFTPYNVWANAPHNGESMTIDDEGFREIIPEFSIKLGDVVKIFFFGGSTVAGGTLSRDKDLIPSKVCANLNYRYQKIRFLCKNYGHNGYNSTNEILLFNKLIIRGDVPDYAVFYHGVNDVTQQVGYGRPHNFDNVFEWAVRIAQDPTHYQRIRVRLLQIVLDTSMLLRWAIGYERKNIIPLYVEIPAPSFRTDSDILSQAAAEVARDLFGKYKVINAISSGFGIKSAFFIQPSLFTTTKKLTPVEEELKLRHIKLVPYLVEAFMLTDAALRKKTKREKLPNIVDARHFLDSATENVFFDLAHTSPYGNAIIADSLSQSIVDLFSLDKKYGSLE